MEETALEQCQQLRWVKTDGDATTVKFFGAKATTSKGRETKREALWGSNGGSVSVRVASMAVVFGDDKTVAGFETRAMVARDDEAGVAVRRRRGGRAEMRQWQQDRGEAATVRWA
ncbi:UNVERIFIED_CONTAM: hypothetical protein Sindi_1994600 [Sesamum indicum]